MVTLLCTQFNSSTMIPLYKKYNANNNNNRPKKKAKKPSGDGGLPNPTNNWTPTCTFTCCQRYVCNADVQNRLVSNIEILDSKFVATAAAAGYRILSGAKLKRVQMWSANYVAGTNQTMAVEFQTQNPAIGNNSKIFSDTAVGMSNTSYIDARPPKNSFAAMWLPDTATSYNVFYLTAPKGTVVDVTTVFTLMDNETQVPITYAIVGATTGMLYTRYLDNANATPVFLPQMVNFV